MAEELTESGDIRERIGNRNPTFAPAGTFETKDGRYVQIAAGGDKVWQRLVEAMGQPELAEDPRYAVSAERIQRADELEALLADWVGQHDFKDVEERLVGNNVPFGGIYTAADIAEDPHYAARSNLATVEDEELGDLVMPAPMPSMSETPGRITHPGPELGSHNEEIYEGLLKKSAEELASLKENGVI